MYNRGEKKCWLPVCYFECIKNKDAYKNQYQKVLKNLFQTSGSRIQNFLFRFGSRSKSGYQFANQEKFLCFSKFFQKSKLVFFISFKLNKLYYSAKKQIKAQKVYFSYLNLYVIFFVIVTNILMPF